jgi:hypothetical protein
MCIVLFKLCLSNHDPVLVVVVAVVAAAVAVAVIVKFH